MIRFNIIELLLLSCMTLVSFGAHAASPSVDVQFVPSVIAQSGRDSEFATKVAFEDKPAVSGDSDLLDWNIMESSFSRGTTRLPGVSSFSGLAPEADPLGYEPNFLLAQSSDTAIDTDSADSGSDARYSEQAEMAQLAEAMANPLSYLWMLFTQVDTISYDGDVLDAIGEDDVVNTTMLIQPVLSMQLTHDWKMVFRPVIPINSFETVDNVDLTTGTVSQPVGVDLDRETGLGDIVLWAAFSNQYKPPNIFGFGVTTMLDTASHDQLGTGKNSIGPMALAFRITPKWIVGVIAQHFESVGGSDSYTINTDAGKKRIERSDVSLTDIQPVIRYRLSPLTNIGFAPNWRYNHETDEASIPIGIGGDTLVKIGKLPVKIGAEFYHYVQSDDRFGGDWAVRLLFIPILPAPEWSRTPLF